MPTIKLPGQLVLAEINTLAATLFEMHGHQISSGFKFYSASCELGRQCWNAAVITYFNTVVRNSGVPIADYLLPELTEPADVNSSLKQPLVTY